MANADDAAIIYFTHYAVDYAGWPVRHEEVTCLRLYAALRFRPPIAAGVTYVGRRPRSRPFSSLTVTLLLYA